MNPRNNIVKMPTRSPLGQLADELDRMIAPLQDLADDLEGLARELKAQRAERAGLRILPRATEANAVRQT